MTRNSRAWLVPLTGLGFIVVGILSFIIGGEPKSADDPAREIVSWYVDNKDSVEVGAILSVVAGVLLVFFGAYLRDVLRAAGPGTDGLSLVAFMGFVVVAVGTAIDGTIMFAAAEAAEDVPAASLVALQALWDNDFLPFILGVELFLWGTGLAVVRTGVLPKWLGWVMIVLAVAGFTPIGFVAAIGSALLVLILSIWLSLRARGPAAPATQ
jgi:Domain of unknown function (DUF4386)